MPNRPSAKKRLRQSEDRRLHNRSIKTHIRGLVRKVREAVVAGDLEKSEAEFHLASKRLDQAAAKKVIHENKASRTKSRMSKAIKGLKDAKVEG